MGDKFWLFMLFSSFKIASVILEKTPPKAMTMSAALWLFYGWTPFHDSIFYRTLRHFQKRCQKIYSPTDLTLAIFCQNLLLVIYFIFFVGTFKKIIPFHRTRNKIWWCFKTPKIHPSFNALSNLMVAVVMSSSVLGVNILSKQAIFNL